MFSKRLILGLLFITFISVSCGLHIGEHAPAITPLEYSGKGYSCVGQIPLRFEDYANDRLSNDQITDFMRCLQSSFAAFAQLTRGRDESTYAPDEIRRFLEKYFIKDRKISDGLLHQVMVIKQVLVGGDLDRISRSELKVLIDILEDIRVEAIHLKPHIPILNPRLVRENTPPDLGNRLNMANEALSSSIQVFAQRLQKSQRAYLLTDFESFITEFRDFVGWKTGKDSPSINDWVNFLGAFKGVTVSPVAPTEIREVEWVPLAQSLSRWYLAFLQYEVGIKDQPVLQGVGLQNVLYLAQRIFDLAEDAVDRQPVKTITFEQASRLMISLHKMGWIPKRVKISSLNTVFRALVTRVFGDAGTLPSDRRSEGMTLLTIANIKSEFYRWAYVQLKLDSQKDQAPSGKSEAPDLQINPTVSPDIRAKISKLKGSDWDEFLKVKSLIRPLFPEDVNRVYLVPDSEFDKYNLHHGFHNLSMMNVLRAGVALIFRGYAEDTKSRWLWTSGLQSSEMKQFFDDVRELGIDLGIVDSGNRTVDTGSRAFSEGKLFTYASKGLEWSDGKLVGELSFVETMEYFAFLYSGGKTADDIYDQLLLNCRKGPEDDNGIPRVERNCVKERLPALLEIYMVGKPHLQEFLHNASDKQKRMYGDMVLETASTSSRDLTWVEHNEMGILAVIVHYAEAVMTRYDTNQDGYLTNPELENEDHGALPIFRGFIQKIAKENPKIDLNLWSWEVTGVFRFIVDHRKLPTRDDAGEVLLYLRPIHPQVKLDRQGLAEVFRAIIGSLMTVPTPEKKASLDGPAKDCLAPQDLGSSGCSQQ